MAQGAASQSSRLTRSHADGGPAWVVASGWIWCLRMDSTLSAQARGDRCDIFLAMLDAKTWWCIWVGLLGPDTRLPTPERDWEDNILRISAEPDILSIRRILKSDFLQCYNHPNHLLLRQKLTHMCNIGHCSEWFWKEFPFSASTGPNPRVLGCSST